MAIASDASALRSRGSRVAMLAQQTLRARDVVARVGSMLSCMVLGSAFGIAMANAQTSTGAAASMRTASIAQGPRSPDLDRIPQLLVRYTNELRRAHQVEPTTVSEQLARTAAYFVDYMARTDQIGHTADGSTPAARAKQHGYNFCMVSENIAYQFHSAGFATEELAQRLVKGWETSPGHRRNMLDPDAIETGTAVARSPRTGRYYAVQMFGRPRSAMYAFQIANHAGSSVRYQFAGKGFDLPPRSGRTHEQCRAAQLVLQGVGEEAQSGVQPMNGDRFAVVQDRQGMRLVKE